MTREELEVLDIDALDERKEELRTMMDASDADLDAIEAEVDVIKELRAVKVAERETRKAEMAEVIEGRGETVEEEKEIKMDVMEIRKSQAYEEAFANYIKTGDDKECRALLSENASGTVAVPVVVEDIVRTAWEREGIMSRVRKTYLKGNLKVGFELSADAAVIHTEGAAAPSEESLVLGTVSIVPQSIKKWISISDEVMDLRGEAFLQYIYDELAYQIAKKAADTLVAAIVAATTASTATAVAVPAVAVATASIDAVAKGLALLSDEATDPVVIMNKATYPTFKALQYANGYGADPFEGLPVVFNSAVASYAAATAGDPYLLVGDLGHGAIANFPAGEEITFKVDDLSLAEKDLVKIVGREYVGLGIVAPKAFAKVTK